MRQPFTPKPRAPLGLLAGVALLALLALLLAGAVLAWLAWQWHTLEVSYPFVSDTIKLAIFLGGTVFLLWAAALIVVGLYNRWAGRAAAYADKEIAHTRARVQVAPMASSFNYHNAPQITSAPAAPAQLAIAEAPDLAIPTFATMLDQNLVGAGRKLVLGYDEGGVMEGDWTDLYSTAIGGMPGQGKTTTQRFFACQTALHGARFACIDPHFGAGPDSLGATLAPLGATFLCPIASDDKTMLDTVRHVADIGAQRVKGLDKGTTPIILWVDELTALLGRSSVGDDLADLLERIAQEYRKKGIYVSASGQIWSASRATSELRDSFASVIAHRMKRGQARMLLPTDEAQMVERLSPGRAVLWRTSGATTLIGIPNTTEADVVRVAQMIGGSAQTAPTTRIAPAENRHKMGFQPAYKKADSTQPLMPQFGPSYAAGGTAPSLAGSGQTVPVEAQRAYTMFMGGKTPAEIVLELRGIKSNAGSTYQKALKEIMDLIRQAIAGGVK